MEIDRAKLFVGGISRETNEESLRVHFSRYGEVAGTLVAKDKTTKIPRGFGFVWFSDPSFADKALQESHVIMGRTVEVKKAIPKSEQHQNHQQLQPFIEQKRSGFNSLSSTRSNIIPLRTKKIFVGGLSAGLTQEQFKLYFERFGKIVDVVVMQDSSTNRPRGFGFVTFDSEDSVEKVMLNPFHELNGRQVEVKRAVPKDEANMNKNNNNISLSSNYTSWSSTSIPEHPKVQPYSYSSGYQLYQSYAPMYMGGYPYGTGLYSSGYQVLGYGRAGFGTTPVVTGNPWSGPVIVGGASLAPIPILYGNGYLYPSYPSGGYGDVRSMVNNYTGFVGSGVDEKLNMVLGSSVVAPSNMVTRQAEGLTSQVHSLSLRDGTGSTSSS
ncbi:RNA-binding protein 1 [Linum perenne]